MDTDLCRERLLHSLVRSNPVHSLFILFKFHDMEHPVIAIITNKFS